MGSSALCVPDQSQAHADCDREFSRLMAWDGQSKVDVDRHFGDVSDTLQMLKFLARNIDITDVFKSVILATLNLPPDDLHDAFALQALYQAASPYLPNDRL